MASQKDAISYEEARYEDNKAEIHLHKRGKFYQAFNWSAWLINVYALPTINVAPLVVTFDKLKHMEDEFVRVGFPLNSLDKFLHGLGMKMVDNTEMVFTVDLPIGLTYPNMVSPYNSWKEKSLIEAHERKDKTKVNKSVLKDRCENQIKQPLSIQSDAKFLVTNEIMELIKKVLVYPLERMTPIENTNFIALIKNEFSKLFA